MRSFPPSAVAVALAGLTALAAASLVPLEGQLPGNAAATAAADPLALPSVPPLSQLGDTTARPLFSPTRRPVPSTAGTESPPGSVAALFNRYRLQGVVIDGNRRRVLLNPAPNGKPISVGEGESVDGWTIDRIAPERLILRSGDRVETVELGTAKVR